MPTKSPGCPPSLPPSFPPFPLPSILLHPPSSVYLTHTFSSTHTSLLTCSFDLSSCHISIISTTTCTCLILYPSDITLAITMISIPCPSLIMDILSHSLVIMNTLATCLIMYPSDITLDCFP